MRPSALRKLASGHLRILPFDEIDRKVRAGEYQYHHFDSCFVITQVSDYRAERLLEVILLFGDGFLDKRQEIDERLVAFAKEQGCKAIESLSRRGLAPAMKSYGWRTKRVLLRREVT